ncbi:MAG: hypothetical protein ABIN37_07090, partial [Burkholderiaceae bacterium]
MTQARFAALDRIGGRVLAVASSGGHLLVGLGQRLAVVDVSNTSAPKIIGQTAPVGFQIERIFTGGQWVVVAASPSIALVDLSDPADPRRVSGLPDVFWPAVAVDSQRLYGTGSGDNLKIMPLSSIESDWWRTPWKGPGDYY